MSTLLTNLTNAIGDAQNQQDVGDGGPETAAVAALRYLTAWLRDDETAPENVSELVDVLSEAAQRRG